MEDKFAEILEKDEQIVKVIKPVKSRYIKSFWMFCIPFCWPHLIVMMVFTLFTLPYFLIKGINNTYYAYTNKRLIARSGIFGNSYRSLEYKDITSTSVHVGFLDKKTKTGTLAFSSPSAHHQRAMYFSYIENPYQEMNAIKEVINSANK